MDIDKIFIINLEHRTDRKEQIIKEMKKVGVTNYEFFKAIRPSIADIISWNNFYCNHVRTSFDPKRFVNYQIGCLGCLKSHVEVCKLALSRGYKNILILEDDTEFLYGMENLYKYASQINNKYSMLYLCGSHLGSKKQVSENIIKVVGTHTTGSYLIKEPAMRFLVDHIQSYGKEIDVFYGTILQYNLDCYCTYPHITKQRDGYSDIQQGEVSYKTAV